MQPDKTLILSRYKNFKLNDLVQVKTPPYHEKKINVTGRLVRITWEPGIVVRFWVAADDKHIYWVSSYYCTKVTQNSA